MPTIINQELHLIQASTILINLFTLRLYFSGTRFGLMFCPFFDKCLLTSCQFINLLI